MNKERTDVDDKSTDTMGYDRVQFKYNSGDPLDPEKETPEIDETLSAIADAIDLVAKNGKDSRSKETAMEMLEDAAMWAVKSITIGERSNEGVSSARNKAAKQAEKDKRNEGKG